jgi:hypothetical protein
MGIGWNRQERETVSPQIHVQLDGRIRPGQAGQGRAMNELRPRWRG